MRKHGAGDPALSGGSPVFLHDRRAGRPDQGDRQRFLERMNRVPDSEWPSHVGPLVHEFEERIAELAGIRRCVSLCDATVAPQMLIGDTATGEAPEATAPRAAEAVRAANE